MLINLGETAKSLTIIIFKLSLKEIDLSVEVTIVRKIKILKDLDIIFLQHNKYSNIFSRRTLPEKFITISLRSLRTPWEDL